MNSAPCLCAQSRAVHTRPHLQTESLEDRWLPMAARTPHGGRGAPSLPRQRGPLPLPSPASGVRTPPPAGLGAHHGGPSTTSRTQAPSGRRGGQLQFPPRQAPPSSPRLRVHSGLSCSSCFPQDSFRFPGNHQPFASASDDTGRHTEWRVLSLHIGEGAVPSPRRGAVPSLRGGAVPSPRGGAVHSLRGGAVPSPRGGAVHSRRGGAVPFTEGRCCPFTEERCCPFTEGRCCPFTEGRCCPFTEGRCCPFTEGRCCPLQRGEVLSLQRGEVLSLHRGEVLSLHRGEVLSLHRVAAPGRAQREAQQSQNQDQNSASCLPTGWAFSLLRRLVLLGSQARHGPAPPSVPVAVPRARVG